MVKVTGVVPRRRESTSRGGEERPTSGGTRETGSRAAGTGDRISKGGEGLLHDGLVDRSRATAGLSTVTDFFLILFWSPLACAFTRAM